MSKRSRASIQASARSDTRSFARPSSQLGVSTKKIGAVKDLHTSSLESLPYADNAPVITADVLQKLSELNESEQWVNNY